MNMLVSGFWLASSKNQRAPQVFGYSGHAASPSKSPLRASPAPSSSDRGSPHRTVSALDQELASGAFAKRLTHFWGIFGRLDALPTWNRENPTYTKRFCEDGNARFRPCL